MSEGKTSFGQKIKSGKIAEIAIAVLLLIFKPEQEKLAWWLTVGGWFVVVFMYVGHVSTAILGSLNL